MTAVNIGIANGGHIAHILTDGALYRSYNRKGVMAGRVTKVKIIPHAGTVIAIRGSYRALLSLIEYCDGCESFDEIVERFPIEVARNRVVRAARRIRQVINAVMQPGRYSKEGREAARSRSALPVELFFVGYSDKDKRVKAVHFDSEGEVPYAPEEGEYWIAPGVMTWEEARVYLPRGNNGFKDSGAMPAGLLALMKEQRRICNDGRAADLKAGVKAVRWDVIGGHVTHTMVSAAGIQHRLIHRFPDEVGKPVGESE